MTGAALQHVGCGEEYSLIQVACKQDSKNGKKLGNLSVIFEHWVTGNDLVEHAVVY
jgi:hypothetical protein